VEEPDLDTLLAHFAKVEERTRDVAALSEEYEPDWSALDDLLELLPEGSERRNRLELTSTMLKNSQVHAKVIFEQRTEIAMLFQSAIGLARRVVALEQVVTNLAGRVSELEGED
jgi:hypothetical protein